MNALVMLISLGLFALWIIALVTATNVATWFLWLVFAAAVALFVLSALSFTRMR